MVAIHKELEAWLLADGTALSAVLSRPAHPVSIKDTKNAETIGNPKKALEKLFETHHGLFQPIPQQGSYQPKLMALRIAENLLWRTGQIKVVQTVWPGFDGAVLKGIWNDCRK